MTQDASSDAPLIDSHAHVYTTDMPLSATAWHKPPADATIDQYVATLDRHGVKCAVLAAASLFDDYNEYSIEAARRHKRLRTTAIVKPTLDPYVMRMMKDDGVVGVRLQWRNVKNLPDITTPEYRKFFRRVREQASGTGCPMQTCDASSAEKPHSGSISPETSANDPGAGARHNGGGRVAIGSDPRNLLISHLSRRKCDALDRSEWREPAIRAERIGTRNAGAGS